MGADRGIHVLVENEDEVGNRFCVCFHATWELGAGAASGCGENHGKNNSARRVQSRFAGKAGRTQAAEHVESLYWRLCFKAIDDDSNVTGQMLAGMLKWPQGTVCCNDWIVYYLVFDVLLRVRCFSIHSYLLSTDTSLRQSWSKTETSGCVHAKWMVVWRFVTQTISMDLTNLANIGKSSIFPLKYTHNLLLFLDRLYAWTLLPWSRAIYDLTPLDTPLSPTSWRYSTVAFLLVAFVLTRSKAKKKPLDKKAPADYGVEVNSRLETVSVDEPPVRQAGVKVRGNCGHCTGTEVATFIFWPVLICYCDFRWKMWVISWSNWKQRVFSHKSESRQISNQFYPSVALHISFDLLFMIYKQKRGAGSNQ